MATELFLIDGNSLVYRAFYALPETIATSKGQPTNAIFGFASMLVKILTEHGASPTLVVWDGGMSGRDEISPDYKAGRKSRPDLLREQWPHFEPLVAAFGYENVKIDGFEADDVIATLTEQAKQKGIETMVLTGDRDMFQLIEPGVRVMATSRGITETKTYDREAVVERYGIPPELIPDFYGLKGDTSDNIPGVPGIGDKTASTLLQEYGDLEGVLGNVENISGAKRKENLTGHAENARMSKQLATAVRDVPVDVDLAAIASTAPDRSGLREMFREFELRDPLRRLEEVLADEAAPASEAQTTLEVSAKEITESELGELKGDLPSFAAGREEREDGSRGALRFGAFAGGPEALYGETEGLAALALAWGERPLVAHDWKSIAAPEEPTDAPPLEHDTMIGAYLLDPAGRNYELAELAEREGLATTAEGIAETAVLTRMLAEIQMKELREQGLVPLLRDIELPLVEVLIDMERAGVQLDTDRLAAIRERVVADTLELETKIYELADEEFTIGSPQQLGQILFEKLGLSKKRRGKTGFSTDARVLQAIRSEHEIIPAVESWRELSKLTSTYLDALPELVDERSRLHTTFGQVSAATGRLSSTDPNLQNIPVRTELGREIRGCFVAEEGHKLIAADYSQVELRVLAHIAGEEVLKDIFRRGEDVHTGTAEQILGGSADPGTRSKAKMVNYGIVYGLSAYGLADRLQIPQDEAQQFIDRYLEGFPKVKEFIDTTIGQATADGHVTTLFGRIRRIPELRARQWTTRSLGERLAVNTVIQGTAADIIKIAMVRSRNALRDAGLATTLLLQIHDELLFEAPDAEIEAASEIIVREMADAFPLDPPLAVDLGVGEDWMKAK